MTHRGRALAALLAVVALVSLVHWHPLFEDNGSETLRDAANQCAACAAGTSSLPEPPAEALAHTVVAPVTLEVAILPAPGAALRVSIPRAPPC